MRTGLAIPTLPAVSIAETQAFYERLGFRTRLRVETPDRYLIVERDGLELHFFGYPTLNAAANYAGAYCRVDDSDACYRGVAASGISTITQPEDKPWGMREFSIIDPSGNLLRIGSPLPRRAGGGPVQAGPAEEGKDRA